MEVSGQITAHLNQTTSLYCVPCERDEFKEPAHGYCQDCQEHLCKTCFQHHRRSRPSKDHVLLDKDAMPLTSTTVDLNFDVITKACINHRDKSLEFYCNNHECLACYVCVALEHKVCKIDYIPDVSGNLSKELKELNTKMEVLVRTCESNIQKVQNNTTQLSQSYENVVEEIRLFRKELNAHLDRMESKMLKEAMSLVNTAKCKLEEVSRACVEIVGEVKRAQSLLDVLGEENKHSNLFIEMKKIAPRITSLSHTERQTVEDNMTDESIEFIGNEKILDEFKLEKTFGMISTNRKPSPELSLSVQYERTMNMSTDKETSDVSGMVMISTKHIIVADHRNKKIKLIYALNGALVSEKTLSSAPYNIIELPSNKLAVTLLDEKCILIMSYNNKRLSSDRRIDVGQECYCVAFCQGKLVVGCNRNPEKLIFLDLQGNIIQIYTI